MNKYYSPNESQMRAAVKGGDRYDYYRRRVLWLRIALAALFFLLWAFVFFYGLMDWSR